VLAKIWRIRCSGTNAQVIEYFNQAAVDLGVVGSDKEYNNGLGQAKDL
jgi:hypothetical protein